VIKLTFLVNKITKCERLNQKNNYKQLQSAKY